MISTHPIFGPIRLNLGVFCANTVATLTTARDAFTPTWSDCLTVARMADAAGLEALVPIARWKGYVDDDFGHPSNEVLEPFTYAAAMAQATRQIAVFAITHAPTVHPLIVAKQAAGLDGVIMSYVDFIDGLQRFCREVLPMLRAAGVRSS